MGDLFKTQEELKKNQNLLRKRINRGKVLGGPSNGGDELIVWETEVEKEVSVSDEKLTYGKKFTSYMPNKRVKNMESLPSEKPKGPDKDLAYMSPLQMTYVMAKQAVRAAWRLMSPVFNPHSGLRCRWVRNELTWQDVLLIGAAGVFGGGAFLAMVLCARLVGIGLQIVKAFLKICKMLVGFTG